MNAKPRQRIRESPFWRAYHEHRYTILFYALLLTLVLMPITATIGLSTTLIRIPLGACLFAALLPNATKHTRTALIAATFLLIVARFVAELESVPVNPGVVLAVVGITGLLAAALALRYAITASSVDSETVCAALSTYLLAGVFFGQIYWSIENIRPGSFVGPDGFSELIAIYYSFVTLATLGYGDVLPRTDIARGVAVFEVIGGQLFLAVMVARLIGAFDVSKRA
jgi:voltage-gated potassium channel